jgi:ABC-type polysaccharide/polyol phosphate export permease
VLEGARVESLRRSADVLRALVIADVRLRYGRGRFRAVKWLLDPYFAAGVYLLLVAFVFNRPGDAAGLSIACAIVPFQLVMMTVMNALTAIKARRSIITNMRFERGLIPLASTVTEAIAFGATMTLIVVMMAAYGVAPTAAVLWLPVLVAVTFLVALAAAYPAVLAGLWFPQANNALTGAARATFFIAPGLVALDTVGASAQDWLRANPLTGVFEAFRNVFLEGTPPEAWQLGIPVAIALVALSVFVPLYRREETQLAKLVE